MGNVRFKMRRNPDGGAYLKRTEQMDRETRIDVDAEYVIRHRETAKEDSLEVKGLECVWHWDDSTRDAAEYWAVADWIAQTYGNTIDWFSIKSWTGSPRKERG